MKKVLAFGWLAALLAVTTAVLPFTTAGASDYAGPRDTTSADQRPVVVNAGQTVKVQYPTIAGQDTVTPTANDNVDPATCRDQNQELTCNVIPIDFNVPAGYSLLDTYVATLTVDWNPGVHYDTGNSVAGSVNGDDLDIYLWHNPQCPPKPTTCPSTPIEHSAGTNVPEVLKIDVTSGQHFQLVVNHAQGTVLKDGYSLTVATVYSQFLRPSESLAAGFTPHDASADSAGITPSFTGSNGGYGGGFGGFTGLGGSSGSSSSSSNGPTLGAGLTPGSGALDPSLAGLTGSGLPEGATIFKQAAVVKPPKHVRGINVVIALVLVPLMITLTAGFLFLKRRPAALTIKRAPAPVTA